MKQQASYLAAAFLAGGLAHAQKFDTDNGLVKGLETPGHYGAGSSLAAGGSDDCTNAAASNTLVGVGTFPVNTVGATTGAAPAQPQTPSTIKNDVWFYWVAPSTGNARLETCGGATVDTKVAAWLANNGTACPSGTNLAYNDDACALQSRINWSVTAGTAYFLQVGAYTEGVTYSGTFTLNVLTPPTNDVCGAPVALTGNGPHNFDTTLASTGTEGQAETLCLSGTSTGIGRDIWFTWTANFSGTAAVSTVGGTTLDTKVAIYAGTGCPAPGTALGCNDDTNGAQSLATFPVTNGATYLIQLGQDPTNTTAGGTGTFTIIDAAPPANDNCSTPTAISGAGPHAFNTLFAATGTEGQGETLCGTNTAVKKDVWYVWTAGFTGVAAFSTVGGTTLDTKIAAYPAAGCPAVGTALACNDDSGGSQSRVTFAVTSGASYLLQLGQDPTNTTNGGAGTFRIDDTTPPANDACAAATVISGGGPFPYNTTNTTTGTEGQAEAICLFFSTTAIQKDLWFTWTSSTSGPVTITTCNQFTSTTTDTKIAVYDGAGCPTAAALACNDDNAACTTQTLSSELTFTAVCGNTYTIQLGNYSATASIIGTFTVTESGTPCVAGTAYCFGDGTAAVACPCGNAGAAGNGCASSINANGANLAGAGNASIAGDTLALTGSGMPNSNALYFQGTTQIAAAFGDGLRCAGGSVIRLGTKLNVAGTSTYPAAGDLSVSVRGNVTTAGSVRNYQAWYRNAAAFCTPSTFNLTNGFSVTWAP